MFSKSYLVAGLFLAASSLALASTSIGTASARGDMRIDGYAVNGNATLFDGTAVQTAQSTATLRLQKGTQIRLGTDSQGTLFHDHMILQQGKTELSTSEKYQVDASTFHVTAMDANTRGVVTITDLGTIQVAALAGSFKVTDQSGQVLATVNHGTSQTFSSGAGAGSQDQIGTNAGLKGATIVLIGGVAGIALVETGIYHSTKSTASR